jgi:hypothetical protein
VCGEFEIEASGPEAFAAFAGAPIKSMTASYPVWAVR